MTSSNQGTISAFLASKGLSPGAIAGIEGNLQVESNFDPTNHSGDSGTSWGIAQWHLSRQVGLVNYANQQGTSWTNLGTQLNYLWSELTGPYKSTLTALQQPGITPTQAATVFSLKYEGNAAGPAARVTEANKIAASQGGIGAMPGGYANPLNYLASGGAAVGNGVQSLLGDAYNITPLGQVTGGVSNAVNAVKDVGSATVAGAKAVVSAGEWMSNPHNWLRVLYVVGGGALVLMGVYVAFKDTGAGRVVSTGVKSGAKLAAL